MRHIQDLTSDNKIVIAGRGLHHEHVSPQQKRFLKQKKEKSASSPFSPLMSVVTPTALNLDEHSHRFPRLDVVFKKFIWCLSLAGDRFLVGPPPTKCFPCVFWRQDWTGFDSGSVLQIVVVGRFVTVVQLGWRGLAVPLRCLARNFFTVSDFNTHWETGWEALELAAV